MWNDVNGKLQNTDGEQNTLWKTNLPKSFNSKNCNCIMDRKPTKNAILVDYAKFHVLSRIPLSAITLQLVATLRRGPIKRQPWNTLRTNHQSVAIFVILRKHHQHHRLSSALNATHRLDAFPQSSFSNSFSPMPTLSLVKKIKSWHSSHVFLLLPLSLLPSRLMFLQEDVIYYLFMLIMKIIQQN